jgi:hypothetical protein
MGVLRLIHHLLIQQRNFRLDVLECHPDPLGLTASRKPVAVNILSVDDSSVPRKRRKAEALNVGVAPK